MLRFSWSPSALLQHTCSPKGTHLSPSMTPVTNDLLSPTSIPPTPFIWNPPPASSTSTPFLSFAILTSLISLSSFRTLSGSSKSSEAASSSISPSSSQWYGSASGAASAVLLWRKGGEVGKVLFDGCGGNRGGGEKVSSCSISWSRIALRECVFSHGGGRMLARRWRLSRSASHRGILVLCGGFRGFMRPYTISSPILLRVQGLQSYISRGVLVGHAYS
jgi:hypothetical protein